MKRFTPVFLAAAIALLSLGGIQLPTATARSLSRHAYGLNGGRISQRQIYILLNLRFPQSYGAIKARLGIPAYRQGQRDYYVMPNGNLVVIYYNFQGYAVSYGFDGY